MSREVTAFDARTHLGELLDHVRYTKDPCIIIRHGRPVAALIDYAAYEATRQEGRARTLTPQYAAWVKMAATRIAKGYRPEKIILFGSAARGDLREGSDIDLCIIKRTRKRRLERHDEVITFIPPEIPVDLVIYTPAEYSRFRREGNTTVKEIEGTGRVLYDTKQKARTRMV